MVHFIIVLFILLALVTFLYVSVVIGRWFGKRELKSHPRHKLEVMTVAETSVFGLLALLIAFTFGGAYDRYESRKVHVLEEANAFEKVYNYLYFLPSSYHKNLHEKVSKYLDLHLSAYHHLPFMREVEADLDAALKIEDQIWQLSVRAAEGLSNQSIAQSFVEAVNNMFDEARNGVNLSRVHPPGIIFVLMILLAGLGALLIGYDAAESKKKSHIHTLCYVLLTAMTIYIIINLEYPRTGFIRLNNFDKILLDARNHNNKSFDSLFSLT